MSGPATEAFFERYRAALLDRDAGRIATMYAVPALILFPEASVVVTDQAQTEQFFAGSFGQYDGVTEVSLELTVMAETAHSVWADVTWSYDGRPQERFCYQLVRLDDPQIAVLTPLDLG
jgi:ketosteroid isomerase-like protein